MAHDDDDDDDAKPRDRFAWGKGDVKVTSPKGAAAVEKARRVVAEAKQAKGKPCPKN